MGTRSFIVGNNTGTAIRVDKRIGLGPTGYFNYTVQRIEGTGTATFDTYMTNKVAGNLTTDVIALGAQKSLGDTDALTVGLAADVKQYTDLVALVCTPDVTIQEVQTLDLGDATTGASTYKLTITLPGGVESTATLTYEDTTAGTVHAGQIQTAIQALTGLGTATCVAVDANTFTITLPDGYNWNQFSVTDIGGTSFTPKGDAGYVLGVITATQGSTTLSRWLVTLNAR